MKSRPGLSEFIRNNWHLILLFFIFVTGFWLRSFPARFNEIQALDPFYFYRTSEYVLTHNWQLFDYDILRAYPEGNNPWMTEYLVPIFMPPIVYALGGGWGLSYYQFALLWPAAMGALACVAMYLLASELFRSRLSGLFSAFFLAVAPSFITRSSAGFLEKEPIAGVFIILSLYLMIKSFRSKGKQSLLFGILGGLSVCTAAATWGGMRYIFLLYGAFLGIAFLSYSALVVFDYLFSGFSKPLKRFEKFLGFDMVKAYGLTVILGYLLSNLFQVHAASFGSLYAVLPLLSWLILLAKNLAQRFGIVKEDNIRYFIPGTLLFILLSVVVASMFSDYVYNISSQFMDILTFHKDVVFSTVAENAPGNWNNIASMTSNSFAPKFPVLGGLIGYYAPYVSLWVFMWLGIILIIYRLARTLDVLLFIPLVWILAAFWGVFYYIRLLFLLGPPVCLIGGFAASWLFARRSRLGITDRIRKVMIKERVNAMSFLLVVLAFLIILANVANGYVYSLGIGPSICFPKQKGPSPFDVEPCITFDKDGNPVFAKNQPWYDAIKFMHDYGYNESNGIKYPPVVITWWDFGYWFQTRGGIATVADGGSAGDRTKLAHWFADNVSNWYEWEDYLKHHKVDFILMDYTLPGKYGAISKIASGGEHIYGFIQFQQKGVQPNGNKTIAIFGAGQYELWIPMEGQSVSGTPMLLAQQGGQYLSKQYINKVCTPSGVVQVGNEANSVPGCIAMTKLGIFYIPPETMDTIFVDLMFMDGARLPVKKLYDSGYVIIYRPVYRETGEAG